MTSELTRLALRFDQFGDEAHDLACPLYEHLARQIAQDAAVLRVAQEVRRPPEPNVLFAVVHFLLMDAPEHPLARFYGSLCAQPRPAADAYPAFRAFLLSQRAKALPLLRSRVTQTNEVRRCAYLLPAFTAVHEAAGGQPLALIDVGCSAGLHLLWDHYYYDYGGVQVGDPDAAVAITCELRGPVRPPLSPQFPDCGFRLGIDLHPVDLTDPLEQRWFEALIWPDHPERRQLMQAAIAELLRRPPRIVRGNGVEVLAAHVRDVPPETALIVYHCHALCQARPEEVEALGRVLRACSARRPVHWLACEGSEVRLRMLRDGQRTERKLANKDGHGRWVEWL